MMRIAIAGGGGFAYILARQIAQGANAILILSTREHPEFEELGVQATVVDYASDEGLRYALQGVDLVISTIAGDEQLALIDAARQARVRTFVPSEFEGPMDHRPAPDPLDRGSEAAMGRLRQYSQSRSRPMRYTVFSCGVLYERFGPGGLGAYGIGVGSGVSSPGDFLVDVEAATAEIVELNAQNRPVQVSMTSVGDVARFVAAAIDIGPAHWPAELRMRGDQLSARDIVGACSAVRGIPFELTVHQYRDLPALLDYHQESEDWGRWVYFQRLVAMANGRFTFRQANLNEAVAQADSVEFVPVRFRDWLQRVWPQPLGSQ